jgi:YggT family protein
MVVELIFRFLELCNIVLLVRVIVSWFPVDRSAGWYRALYAVTEPVLRPIRSLVPPIGMVDVSPLVAFLLISVLARVVLMFA